MKTLTALVAAGFLTLFSISAPKGEPQKTQRKNVEQPTKQTPTPWQETLYKIGLESTLDDIERGGIKLGNTAYEIENDARYDGDKFKEFINGDDKNFSTLKGHLLSAKEVRCTCSPEFTPSYSTSFFILDRQMDTMRMLTAEQRKIFDNPLSWALFTQFLPHCIYLTNTEQHNGLKTKIAAYKLMTRMLGTEGEEERFHTHPGGSPPSLQDLKISQTRKEYVVSVTKEGDCKIYLAHKGNAQVVYTYTPKK